LEVDRLSALGENEQLAPRSFLAEYCTPSRGARDQARRRRGMREIDQRAAR